MTEPDRLAGIKDNLPDLEAYGWRDDIDWLVGEVERLRQERDDLALRLADMAIAFAEMKAEHE